MSVDTIKLLGKIQQIYDKVLNKMGQEEQYITKKKSQLT